jgi:predicted transcriptional regulator
MLAAKLTNKQYHCYSLVKEYQRPMNEVERRMGITRKTIYEHITAAEKAMRKLSLKEYRAKAAAKHKHPE